MIEGLSVNAVYLAAGVTDMRKSINGLSIIVAELLGHDPFNGSVFVFCNRHRNKLKILFWEHIGAPFLLHETLGCPIANLHSARSDLWEPQFVLRPTQLRKKHTASLSLPQMT